MLDENEINESGEVGKVSEKKVKAKKKKKKKAKKMSEKEAPQELLDKAISVVYNKDKKQYELVTVMFNMKTKEAAVTSSEFLAEHQYQAVYNFKKFLAENKFIPSGEL